jgi:ribosomal protein S14
MRQRQVCRSCGTGEAVFQKHLVLGMALMPTRPAVFWKHVYGVD